jgi:hypothetical protein
LTDGVKARPYRAAEHCAYPYRRDLMLKNVFLAAATCAVIAGATITAPVTAPAMTCEDAAKMKYPDSIMDRAKYKRSCKKAYKASMGKEGPLATLKMKMMDKS